MCRAAGSSRWPGRGGGGPPFRVMARSSCLSPGRKRWISGFWPGARELLGIAAICRHLDGRHTAGDRIRGGACCHVWHPDDAAANLHDRFALLTPTVAIPHCRGHRPLRAVLDWSYEPLLQKQSSVCCVTSPFSPAASLAEVAAAVVDDGVVHSTSGHDMGIANLVAKSLVVLDRDVASRKVRLSETIRASRDGEACWSIANATARRCATGPLFAISFAVWSASGSSAGICADESGPTRNREIDNTRSALNG